MPSSDETRSAIPHDEPTGKTAEAQTGSFRAGKTPQSDNAARGALAPTPCRGERIGLYVLIDRIGAGAYGEVWRAEQKEPVRREVAVKILNAGLHSTAVVARFRAEQQALALMDHPGIAKVHDAGIAPSGLPYFVMQYVKGDTLLSYCDRDRLALRERLDLFASICDAVHHAHQKGIIHRDLKPSNIVVTTLDTGEPQPVVVDFGIAKAISQPLTDETLHSVLGRPQGTWAYMSPEQADGLADVDTRSDVYSLGVVLYELLSGIRPFDDEALLRAGEEAKRRLIREQLPPSPGARLDTTRTATETRTADTRRTSVRELTRTLRGELGWIPLYAMRKERQRRYDSASQLAADVRNYLEGRPLIAGPESPRYRLWKFVARNRIQVTAMAAVAVALVVGLGTALWQARRADERAIAAEMAERAEKERTDQLEQVSDFQREMLGQLDVRVAGIELMRDIRDRLASALERSDIAEEERRRRLDGFNTELVRVNATNAAAAMIDRTILRPAVKTIEERFNDQPVVDAQLRQALAEVYRAIGLDDAALPLQESALETRRRVLGDEHKATLASVGEMGSLLVALGEANRAEAYYLEALEGRRRTLGEEHPDTLSAMSNMGFLLDALGRPAEAEAYCTTALETWHDLNEADDPRAIIALSNLAWVQGGQGKFAEAERHSREAVERFSRVLGEDHPDTIQAQGNLGNLLYSQGDLAGAEVHFRRTLEGTRHLFGEEHPSTLDALSNMGGVLRAHGKLSEAERYCIDALEKSRRVLGEEHPDTLISLNEMGALLRDKGQPAEAEPYFREAWSKGRRIQGDLHPLTLAFLFNFGDLLLQQGKYREALQALEAVGHVVDDAKADVRIPRLARVLVLLGRAHMGLTSDPEHHRRAEATLLQTYARLEGAGGEADGTTLDCVQALLDLYTAWNAAEPGKGHDAKAEEWKKKLEEGKPEPAKDPAPESP